MTDSDSRRNFTQDRPSSRCSRAGRPVRPALPARRAGDSGHAWLEESRCARAAQRVAARKHVDDAHGTAVVYFIGRDLLEANWASGGWGDLREAEAQRERLVEDFAAARRHRQPAPTWPHNQKGRRGRVLDGRHGDFAHEEEEGLGGGRALPLKPPRGANGSLPTQKKYSMSISSKPSMNGVRLMSGVVTPAAVSSTRSAPQNAEESKVHGGSGNRSTASRF